MTLEEARQRITDGYSQFLRRPGVSQPQEQSDPGHGDRPGKQPGVFTLPVNGGGSTGTVAELGGVGGGGGGWPTMVDVIQRPVGFPPRVTWAARAAAPPPDPRGPTESFVFDYLTVLKNGGFAPNP